METPTTHRKTKTSKKAAALRVAKTAKERPWHACPALQRVHGGGAWGEAKKVGACVSVAPLIVAFIDAPRQAGRQIGLQPIANSRFGRPVGRPTGWSSYSTDGSPGRPVRWPPGRRRLSYVRCQGIHARGTRARAGFSTTCTPTRRLGCSLWQEPGLSQKPCA